MRLRNERLMAVGGRVVTHSSCCKWKMQIKILHTKRGLTFGIKVPFRPNELSVTFSFSSFVFDFSFCSTGMLVGFSSLRAIF